MNLDAIKDAAYEGAHEGARKAHEDFTTRITLLEEWRDKKDNKDQPCIQRAAHETERHKPLSVPVIIACIASVFAILAVIFQIAGG